MLKAHQIPEWVHLTWALLRIALVLGGLCFGVLPGLVLYLILIPGGLGNILR